MKFELYISAQSFFRYIFVKNHFKVEVFLKFTDDCFQIF